jgi:hypothetical protein
MEAMLNGKADSWRRRIADQRASGQSVRAWCKSNGSQEGSFYWWRSRLGLSPKKTRPSKPAKAKPTPLAFAQVVVHSPTAEPLRLRLAGERELILPASMPLEQVAKLVRAIEATA